MSVGNLEAIRDWSLSSFYDKETINDIFISQGLFSYIPKIPVMTSATTPSGNVTASSYFSNSFLPYMAFDGIAGSGSAGHGWLASAADTAPWLAYEFPSAFGFGKITIKVTNNSTAVTKNVYIEGSNDVETWENALATGDYITINFPTNAYGQTGDIILNGEYYKYLRLRGTEQFYGGNNQFACIFDEVQLYEVVGQGSKSKAYIFKDGSFTNRVMPGTSFDNYVGPYRWQNTTALNTWITPYIGTNKIIFHGYNCATNFLFLINANGFITQNINGSYGPNDVVMIPIKRLYGRSVFKFTARRIGTTRLHRALQYYNDAKDRYNASDNVMINITTDFVTYEVPILSDAPYVDYIQFLLEQGNVEIKEMWFE